MKKILLIILALSLLTPVALWAGDGRPGTGRTGYSGCYMGPGTGYHGRGPGMWGRGSHMGWGMGSDWRAWESMTPEQREKWQSMRADFLRDTLPLRQELNAKVLELETLWDQKNPDSKKMSALTDRIIELRAKLEKKQDVYLLACRQNFGDLGWSCPGGGWRGY
ncbi:MAG: periplasmic heavy metal sensor [Deltaproteobacteria bacterium]|nr:periplasmic heavy metal sensor [Deltaproteobacteria bacterium]